MPYARSEPRKDIQMHPKWKSIGEAVTAIAVVVGLALVFFELQQLRVIARAEFSSDSAQILREILEAEQSPGFSKVLLKSRLSPKELTASERLQVRAFLDKVLLLYDREKYNYDRGIFETWEEYIYYTAPIYFGYGYGRAYFEAIKSRGKQAHNPEQEEAEEEGPVLETIDLAIQNTDAVRFAQDLDELTLRKLDENNR